MGRVSRHKKIKACDPFYRGPRQEKSQKVTIFSTNDDHTLDEQKIPRAAKIMIRNMAKPNPSKQRGAGKKTTTKTKPDIKFQKQIGETKKDYLNRIDREAALAVANSMKESRELRGSRKRYLKKRKEKLKDKKKEDAFKDNDPVAMRDEVRFGEVVQQPPMITAKPRKVPKSQGSKSLLLNTLINKKSESDHVSSDNQQNSSDSSTLLRARKRKNMTPHEKLAFDEERERAIAAYRLSKRKRTQKLFPMAGAVE